MSLQKFIYLNSIYIYISYNIKITTFPLYKIRTFQQQLYSTDWLPFSEQRQTFSQVLKYGLSLGRWSNQQVWSSADRTFWVFKMFFLLNNKVFVWRWKNINKGHITEHFHVGRYLFFPQWIHFCCDKHQGLSERQFLLKQQLQVYL